jgi:hypothetical protein
MVPYATQLFAPDTPQAIYRNHLRVTLEKITIFKYNIVKQSMCNRTNRKELL